MIADIESRMLSDYYERKLKTLEQGINDVSMCHRVNRINILFVYDEIEMVRGIIHWMCDKYMLVREKRYYYDKIKNIYNYFTLQPVSLELLKEWYESYEEDPEYE